LLSRLLNLSISKNLSWIRRNLGELAVEIGLVLDVVDFIYELELHLVVDV
jgi:hypothetical protein